MESDLLHRLAHGDPATSVPNGQDAISASTSTMTQSMIGIRILTVLETSKIVDV
jgi:hypothetical protein